MFLIFHIFVPFIIVAILANLLNLNYSKLYLFSGALIADVDKILSVLHIASGRGYCHTILFTTVFIIAIYFISNRKLSKYLPFIFGVIAHLFLDFTRPLIQTGTIAYLFQTPLFYPFCDCDMSPTSLNLIQTINYFSSILVKDKLVLYTELISSYCLAFYFLLNRIELRKSEVFLIPNHLEREKKILKKLGIELELIEVTD